MPELLTVDEVAAFLRISVDAVRARIDRGALPGVVRLGRSVRVRRDDLRAWVGLTPARVDAKASAVVSRSSLPR